MDQLDAAVFDPLVQNQLLEAHACGLADHMAEIGCIVPKMRGSFAQRTSLVMRLDITQYVQSQFRLVCLQFGTVDLHRKRADQLQENQLDVKILHFLRADARFIDFAQQLLKQQRNFFRIRIAENQVLVVFLRIRYRLQKKLRKVAFGSGNLGKTLGKEILIDDKVDDDIILSGLRDGMGDIRIDQNNIPLFQKDIFVVDRLPALPAVDKIQFDVLMDMFRDMDEARMFVDEIILICRNRKKWFREMKNFAAINNQFIVILKPFR